MNNSAYWFSSRTKLRHLAIVYNLKTQAEICAWTFTHRNCKILTVSIVVPTFMKLKQMRYHNDNNTNGSIERINWSTVLCSSAKINEWYWWKNARRNAALKIKPFYRVPFKTAVLCYLSRFITIHAYFSLNCIGASKKHQTIPSYLSYWILSWITTACSKQSDKLHTICMGLH